MMIHHSEPNSALNVHETNDFHALGSSNNHARSIQADPMRDSVRSGLLNVYLHRFLWKKLIPKNLKVARYRLNVAGLRNPVLVHVIRN